MSRPPERNPIEIIAGEFVSRLRGGHDPSIAEYLRKHPQWAGEIQEALPAVLMLEQCRPNGNGNGNGYTAGSDDEPLAIRRIGDFRIIREIGRGGMGVVYEAVQESLGRVVALKVLSRRAVWNPKSLARFEREAQTAAKLHHTNIVPVFGVGQEGGQHYYVMQLIQGQGLDRIVRELRDCREPSDEVDVRIDEDAGVQMEAPSGSTSVAELAKALLTIDVQHRDESVRVPRPQDSGLNPLADIIPVARPDEDSWIELTPPPDESSSGLEHLDTQDAIARSDSVALTSCDFSAGRHPSHGEAEMPPVEYGDVRTDEPPPPLSRTYWRNVGWIGQQVAEALHYAHSQGTLHRDVKPANLVLDETGNVWITDFGLAKFEEDQSLTNLGDVVGTLAYMAPEQFDGHTDHRTDIYSLGITLYELLTLNPAYDDFNRQRLIRRIIDESPGRPSARRADIPRDLETVVLKAIARDPADRYQTAAELAEDLDRFLTDRPINARRVHWLERSWRWCRRNRLVAALSGLAMCLMLMVAIVASVGYFRVRTAYEKMQDALRDQLIARSLADEQRQRAETTLDSALAVLEPVFKQATVQPDSVSMVATAADPEGLDDAMAEPIVSHYHASLLQRLLKFYDGLAEPDLRDPRVQFETALAYRHMADIQLRLGQTTQAQVNYVESVMRLQELRESHPEHQEYSLEAATALNSVGTMLLDNGRTGYHLAAREAFSRAVGIYRELRESGDVDRITRLLEIESLNRLAYASALTRRVDDAQNHLDQALKLIQELQQDDPSDPASLHAESRVRRTYSLVLRPKNRTEALHSAAQSVSILETLVERFPLNPRFKYDLIDTYYYFENLPVGPPGLTPEARRRRALQLANDLHGQYPLVPEYQKLLTRAIIQLGAYLKRDGRSRIASNQYRRAVGLQEDLVQKFPDSVDLYEDLADSSKELAEILISLGELSEARYRLDRAIKFQTWYLSLVEQPKPQEWQQLIEQHEQLAETLAALAEPILAEIARAEADQLRQQLPEQASPLRRRALKSRDTLSQKLD